MKIDFEQIKKQNVDSDTLLHLLEVIYSEVKACTAPNIIFNEYVDTLEVVKTSHATYAFTLSKTPISQNDLLIVSEDGSVYVTPSSIIKIEGTKVYFKNLQINSDTPLFVTYKY
ncbi:MAG: hypothetical protein ACRCX2_19895 [Paraclostridium sp.]